MAEVFISFKAEGPEELMQLMVSYLVKNQTPPSWVGAPLDVEALQAEAAARDAFDQIDTEDDARHIAGKGEGNGAEPDPASEPAPTTRRARAPRGPRVSVTPPPPYPLAPAPAPEPPPEPPADLPPLDTLKAVVTAAVRLAQKGEGSKKILDLLPGFKDTTGLTFVMNAEDKHRVALYDLVQAAGLPVV